MAAENDSLDAPKLGNALHVVVTREPFMDFFLLTLDNGYTEELEVEDTRAWFKERGADMDKVEKALDHCWNFYYSEINILNPKEPNKSNLPHAPNI